MVGDTFLSLMSLKFSSNKLLMYYSKVVPKIYHIDLCIKGCLMVYQCLKLVSLLSHPGGEDQLGRPLLVFPTTTPEMLTQRYTTAHLILLLRYYVTMTDVVTRRGGAAVVANLTTYSKDALSMVVDTLDKLQVGDYQDILILKYTQIFILIIISWPIQSGGGGGAKRGQCPGPLGTGTMFCSLKIG